MLALACLGVILRSAWVCDDAFITLRTVDNFVNGHGLRWNPHERVQSFTHPLWMGLLSVFYFVTREPFYTTCLVSFGVSAVFLAMLVKQHGRHASGLAMALFGLMVCKSFVDYSTSGLENPLTHVLLCLLFAAHWDREPGTRTLLRVALLAGLAGLNRLDTLVLVAPPLAAAAAGALRRDGFGRTLGALALGFTPLVAWLLFATFYFGAPFPNTAYAKLSTGVSPLLSLQMGLKYVAASALCDPASVLLVLAGLVVAWRREFRGSRIVLVSIALWVAYLLKIGGDFMVGRFWLPPVVLSAVVLARTPLSWRGLLTLPLLVGLASLGLLRANSPLRVGPGYDRHDENLTTWFFKNVADERAYYFQHLGLFKASGPFDPSSIQWAARGMRFGEAVRAGGPNVIEWGPVGMFGYYAGHEARIVDHFALTDPLLARLPVERERFRIGHFRREMPPGYLATVRTGENRIEDPDLAAYYDRLHRIVAGPLWNRERVAAIWPLLAGRHDAELAAYAERRRSRARAPVDDEPSAPDGPPGGAGGEDDVEQGR